MSSLPPTSDKNFWGDDVESIIINKPEKVFKSEVGHRWIQQGPYLVCKSCLLKHTIYIGMDKRLVGLNKDGSPKLKKL